MKKINSLIITALFSFLVVGCGIKGPLYHPPVTEASSTENETDKQPLAEEKVANANAEESSKESE